MKVVFADAGYWIAALDSAHEHRRQTEGVVVLELVGNQEIRTVSGRR